MASRIGKRIKNSGIYYLTCCLIWLLNVVPRRVALSMGAGLGKLAWRLIPRDHDKAVRNLTIAYGGKLSPEEKLSIGRQFFINSGKNIVDVLRFPKHLHQEILPLVTAEGMEHWEAAHRRGKGVFGVTGHLGNFELIAAFIQSQGYQVAVIGREMYDKRLNALLVRNRESAGLTNIATTDSPKRIIDWLKRGRTVGVLIDIDSMRVRSMFVPVFGTPANTPVGQSVIALKTGAALVPAACLRTPDDRYKVVIKPEIQFERSGDIEKDIYTATYLCTKALEEIIDSHRDQWAWIQNRWNTRPENPS